MVALTAGGAFVIGGVAREAVVHAQIARLAGAAAYGYSETALESATRDPGALAVARRHDPYAAAGTDNADREDRLATFADELKARRAPAPAQAPLRRLASLTAPPAVTPARPFLLRGALQESRDLECLTQAVYYEARGETASGQAAVAQVVLNRSRHPAFPKTVCGVVFQGVAKGGCQFSFACDGSVHRVVESAAWRRAEKVAARALDGFVMADVGNATHFHVASLSTNWGGRLMRVAQVGAHVFYRFGGRNGAGSAFTATPLPSEPLPAEAAPAAPQPVYASLALAPLANSVANSVVGAAAVGAEMVMAATAPKAAAATRTPAPDPAAKPAAAVAPAPAPAVAPAATTAPVAKLDEPARPAAAAS